MTNIEVKYEFELDYTAVRAVTKKSWIIELTDGRTRPIPFSQAKLDEPRKKVLVTSWIYGKLENEEGDYE